MPCRAERGHTLLEVLIALAITMAVMAVVFRISGLGARLGAQVNARFDRDSIALRCLDQVARDLEDAGIGLVGGADRIEAGGDPLGGAARLVTIRSNPDGIVGELRGPLDAASGLVALGDAALFRTGDHVLFPDKFGLRPARVERVAEATLGLRLGDRVATPSRARGGLVQKVLEIAYALDGGSLYRQVGDGPGQTLARNLERFELEYFDETGGRIDPARLHAGQRFLRGVRVSVSTRPTRADRSTRVFSREVSLEPQSAELTFDLPGEGEDAFALRRLFTRLPGATAVAAREGRDWAVALVQSPLAHGTTPLEPAALLSFPLDRGFGDWRVEQVIPLEGIYSARAALFASEDGPWAGSLVVVSSVARELGIWRVSPDQYGVLSPSSQVEQAAASQEAGEIAGVALQGDTLYLSDPAFARIHKYALGAAGRLETLATVPGKPGALAAGLDGRLYCLASAESLDPGASERTDLLAIPVDGGTATTLATFEGRGRSLAFDPVTGGLYALVEEPLGDTVLLEISRAFLHFPCPPPEVVFRLSAWKAAFERQLPPPDPGIPPNLFPSRFDFASFDANGSLYLGASATSLVLQAELQRPGLATRRIRIGGVAGLDAETLQLTSRLHAWQE
jgi:hypothetical protein